MKPVAAATQDVDDKLKQVGPTADAAGGGLSKLKTVGTGALLGVGIAAGQMAASLVANFALQVPTMLLQKFGEAVDLASNKAESASKAQVLFGDSSRIVEEASKTAAETVGMSSGKYLEMAGTLGNLIVNFGITGDEAANMGVDMIQLAADMGSFNNAEPTDVVMAMGAAFRGETEPIRRFGVMLSSAAVESKAVSMGLIEQGQALDKTSKFQATYALILDQTSAAQGDFARTAEGYANQQRIMAAQQEEAWTRLGEVIQPIALLFTQVLSAAIVFVVDNITALAKAFTDFGDVNAGMLLDIRNLVDAGLKVLGEAFGLVGQAAGVLFDAIGKLVEIALGPLKPVLVGTAIAITAVLLPAMGALAYQFAISAVQSVMSFLAALVTKLVPGMILTQGVAGTMGAVMTLALGPIGLLVIAIAGVTAGMIMMSEAFNEGKENSKDFYDEMMMISRISDDSTRALKEQEFVVDELSQSFQDAGILGLADFSGKVAGSIDEMVEQRTEMAAGGQEVEKFSGGMGILTDIMALVPGEFGETARGIQEFNSAVDDGTVSQLKYKDELARYQEVLPDLDAKFRELGNTFYLTDNAANQMAGEFGVSAAHIQEAFATTAAKVKEENETIRLSLIELPADYEMTAAAATAMGETIGVTGEQVQEVWSNMREGTVSSVADMTAAIALLPPEFQAFATSAGLDMSQIEAMAKNMPAQWGPAAVEMNAAIASMPPEFRKMATESGMSVDQINTFVASLPPEAWAAAEGVTAATERIDQSFDNLSGGLTAASHSSDDAWKAWKDGAKGGADDVVKNIERLKHRLEVLDKVDLATLGPSALLRWGQAKSATQTELGALTSFVDNQSTIVEDLLPDALNQSNIDVSKEYSELYRNTNTTYGNVADTAQTGAEDLASSMPIELRRYTPQLNTALNAVETKTNATYTDSTASVEDEAAKMAAELPNQMRDSISDLTPALNAVKSQLQQQFSSMAAMAAGSGSSVGFNFIEGLSNSIRNGRTKISSAVDYASAPIQAHSPPKVGPLMNIVRWGSTLGDLFVGPLADRISFGRQRIQKELEGYFDARPSNPLAFAGSVASGGGPLGGSEGMGRAGLIVEKQEFNIHGQTPEETERAVEVGMRRAALELSLS